MATDALDKLLSPPYFVIKPNTVFAAWLWDLEHGRESAEFREVTYGLVRGRTFTLPGVFRLNPHRH